MAPFDQESTLRSGVGVGSGVGVPPGEAEVCGAAEAVSVLADPSGGGLGATEASDEAKGDAPPSDCAWPPQPAATSTITAASGTRSERIRASSRKVGLCYPWRAGQPCRSGACAGPR